MNEKDFIFLLTKGKLKSGEKLWSKLVVHNDDKVDKDEWGYYYFKDGVKFLCKNDNIVQSLEVSLHVLSLFFDVESIDNIIHYLNKNDISFKLEKENSFDDDFNILIPSGGRFQIGLEPEGFVLDRLIFFDLENPKTS